MIRPSPRFWIVLFSAIGLAVPGVATLVSGGPLWAWPAVSALFLPVSVATVRWAERMTRPTERSEKR